MPRSLNTKSADICGRYKAKCAVGRIHFLILALRAASGAGQRGDLGNRPSATHRALSRKSCKAARLHYKISERLRTPQMTNVPGRHCPEAQGLARKICCCLSAAVSCACLASAAACPMRRRQSGNEATVWATAPTTTDGSSEDMRLPGCRSLLCMRHRDNEAAM